MARDLFGVRPHVIAFKARACPRTPNMNTARWTIVLVAICAWLAVSNHCAFAALARTSDSAESGCPFHSQPAKPQPPPSGIQCCKILRAVIPVVAKSWARDDGKLSGVDFRIDEFALIAHLHTAPAPLLLDTGPPEAHTFAELILQRSLLAHAPPARI